MNCYQLIEMENCIHPNDLDFLNICTQLKQNQSVMTVKKELYINQLTYRLLCLYVIMES